ncbi:L-threonylcarbamoyladenylate synthase [Neolewinella agarilytica]|uniref:L-threonylcarbamoyladenylate synthase n=1 Tax=Neolewinella agarilytica TaxID=478744 RepID=UPI0023558D7E|nr:L-threonylcarbamoyladenylate synthase [Neolewinella agarilytica]
MTAITIQSVPLAAKALRQGELVAIPTETVYGLGANALNQSAVANIFAAKNRPSFDPLIIHQSSADRILAYAREIPPEARLLADAIWPGPLTLVLPKQESVPDLVSAGLSTVALRVPNHPLTLELLGAVDFPVAAPSANPFGFVSPTTAQHVKDQLGDKIDYILDGGACRVGLESTIVGFPNGVATVLRKGGLAVEKIEEILGHSVEVKTHSNSRPEAPGMLSRHYSPGVAMLIVEESASLPAYPAGSAAIIFGKDNKLVAGDSELNVFNLSPSGDLNEAARTLFAVLRTISQGNYPLVMAFSVPEEGLGLAINDRLRRAAARE